MGGFCAHFLLTQKQIFVVMSSFVILCYDFQPNLLDHEKLIRSQFSVVNNE